ncbi:MAG: threonylcarbamoyl-AMP synthase [Candidatus Methanomethylicota archaeon]|uniref:L-threonylcarbamoyladenylate synthase n=1 Tax=Thermoproteota archaeon TaxID=2056631 RepID=A0A523B9L2_9CREN|nr:MAG: threonylcarbamoyl-AMP synthase [Candidatus Verstraetearchaeota archaeon]TDA37623.1 MAG: threonylcarbamoyl-AMP synthase [Candidatus Verstraetearchaeota archaeon]
MKIKLSLTDINRIFEIGEMIKKGGVIVYPTDTVYGIGGNPFLEDVVIRIKNIKQREEKAMPILVSSLEKAKEIAYFNDLSLKIANTFWPGPLTIVLKTKVKFSPHLTGGRDSIGLRIPNHELALKIIEASGGALIGTSANISGRPPAISIEDLDEKIRSSVDLIIDGGKCYLGKPSTVIEVIDSKIKIIRIGAIGIDEFIKRGIPIEGI